MTEFTFATDVEVRFQDADAAGHVNNAVYATYLEQARIRYFREVIGDDLLESGAVVAHLEVDFRRRVRLDTDAVTVAVRATELGTSSLTLAYEVRTDEGVAATGETVLVNTDGERSEPIPDGWREAITDYETDL